MAAISRQLFWALLFTVLSLPVVYVITTFVLSLLYHGYVMVDPVQLRRISLVLAILVLAGIFLAQRLA